MELIYRETRNFPSEEKFGLVSQLRRSAISLPSNIAEGAGRRGTKEIVHFLHIALGSLNEIEIQMVISLRLQYIQDLADDLQQDDNRLTKVNSFTSSQVHTFTEFLSQILQI